MIIKKNGSELTDSELAQINDALLREFKVSLPSRDQLKDRLFFLLKQGNTILAMGALLEVRPVIFDEKEYVIYGFVNVVANEKGKGYGKQVITAMKEYLTTYDKTGLGFCMLNNKRFYEKCGFNIETTSTQRFVYTKGAERITNQDGQIIFYQDSSDNFMKKVLAKPEKEVSIPTQNLW
ncbi:MAG: GNAT family N-acetyltransferase [bacterium]|nr:GNAT family N-acetyltransferase [bacterium]